MVTHARQTIRQTSARQTPHTPHAFGGGLWASPWLESLADFFEVWRIRGKFGFNLDLAGWVSHE